jgi:hypothetical protein
MALDLTGIENVEFYSGHYLDAVLEGDLKGLFNAWQKAEDEEGKKAPHKRFNFVAAAWEKARKSVAGELDPVERWKAARAFHAELVEALGYAYAPDVARLEDDTLVPLVTRLDRDSRPYLWIVDAPFALDESTSPLDTPLLRDQYPASVEGPAVGIVPRTEDESRKGEAATWRELLDTTLFRLESAPRWVLFLAGDEVLLAERHKWPAGRFLRFDLGALFARRDVKALQAFCALLHRDALAPDSGVPLHDTLEESSHKHAFAVSGDLKHGVRRAVELLANEAVWYRKEVQRKGVFNEDGSDLAAALEKDCLTWLYRLLFLFYVEARSSELGVVPMKSDAYRKGYSLESLRDLELVPLTTEKAREGYYIDGSLKKLFELVNGGFLDQGGDEDLFSTTEEELMRVHAMRAPLFDDDKLSVLKGVRFRNRVLLEVLQLLSLSAVKRNKPRGRISYAQLGINQLGAVYEGLLSYTGFFATEDLYEVAAEKDCEELSGKPAAEREALKTYFVPASRIGDYKDGEIVKDEHDRRVVHKKGSFIFRLAGRNREKSASYYTPEVLTKCLVKYALKELLWEQGKEGEKPKRKKTADEILALTICEPAMGSSAFLIEAVDQLADAYLETRQEEVKASGGETIPPEDYQREKRRVKARLATNNCYGVDLNPTAVELAKVSLWLATLHEDGKCPWFGLRLATGNSLVGARREVFKTSDVIRKGTTENPNWLGLVPEPVSLHHGESGPPIDTHWTAPRRPKGTIYHFLLPAEGMAAFDKDKVIKELAPDSVKRIQSWRKEFCKPFSKSDAQRLEQISDAVDRLFTQVVRERVLATQETSDRIPVWGEPQCDKTGAQQADLLVRDQEEVAASLEDGSSAYRRLKLAMDAWCALWFWPIEEAGLLPDRATWLAQMELILKGQVTHEEAWNQQSLFADLSSVLRGDSVKSARASAHLMPLPEAHVDRLKRLRELSEAFRGRRAEYFEECGLADIDAVLEGDTGLRTVQAMADSLHFHHWALRFAEVFAAAGGFGLILGNPPWIKLQWAESALLSDYNPLLDIRGFSASTVASMREGLLTERSIRSAYLGEFAEMQAMQRFLSERQNFPSLAGMQSNVYKCFVERSWTTTGPMGASAFLHPEGVYDDPNGGPFRRELYPRLAFHFQLRNALKLFPEVHDTVRFSLNVYRGSGAGTAINFTTISNLVHPSTIDASFMHDGHGPVPGITDEHGNWDLSGHANRLVSVNLQVLSLFKSLYDKSDTPSEQARLPVVHSVEVLSVIGRFADQERTLDDLGEGCFVTEMWHETYAQRDGTIARETRRPESIRDWILQGPHIYVGNLLAKSPNEECRHNQDYSAIDLAHFAEGSLPRSNYHPSCDESTYRSRTAHWRGKPVSDSYRIITRKMINPTSERTLIAAIAPPGLSHIDGCLGIALDPSDLIIAAGMFQSLPFDFLVKSTGRTNFYEDSVRLFPLIGDSEITPFIVSRALLLNCVLRDHSSLWSSTMGYAAKADAFTSLDKRLQMHLVLFNDWQPHAVLRSDYERRQALVEIDVLSALALRMGLEELSSIYRFQFPVLQDHERKQQYDQLGRIVSTSKTAAGNPAVSLVELAATLKEQAGFDVHAEYHPDGSNTQDLGKQNIRLGKKEADVLGVSERCTMADLLAETEVRWSDADHPEGRPVRLVGLRYTDPGLEPRMERVYPTPWTRCDREADYRQAWAEFERRLGKKMPENGPTNGAVQA